MRFLTDTNDRTKHTDEFYESIFSPKQIEKLFIKESDGSLVIREQDEAVHFDGRKYYWYGLIYSFWKSERACYYSVKNDNEMKNVRFRDGSPVKSLMFGCWKWQRCCGTECCFETAIFTSMVLLLTLAGIYACIYSIFKNSQSIPLYQENIPLDERRQ